MDDQISPIEAMTQTHQLVAGLIDGLNPAHREAPTPCDQWTVHDLIEHMCGGAHAVASGLQGETLVHSADDDIDLLADGPAVGWKRACAHLQGAATPVNLEAVHSMPFGEVPGSAAVAVISADHITHAWDLARATDQPLELSDTLAGFALATWEPLVPADGRTGDGFKPPVPVDPSSPMVDRLVAYTGRQP